MSTARPLPAAAQLAAVLLALGVLGGATGLLPMAGLLASSRDPAPRPAPAPHEDPVAPAPVSPVSVPVVVALVPSVAPAPFAAQASQQSGPFTLRAGARDGVLLRGGDRETWVVSTVEVAPDDGPAARPPVDMALVLDTSGSMAQAMPLLRRATLGLIEHLAAEDRLVLVSYSTDARTLFTGRLDAEGRARLARVVSDLVPSGGTNLSAGLAAGVCGLETLAGAQPRAQAARAQRVVLLTDGRANQGVTEPSALAALVGEQRSRGLALSTLGLGNDYNEDLLAALADRGGGAFHHAATGEALPAIYEAELSALRRLAAREAALVLEPAPGVVVLGVESWPASRVDGRTLVPLGDLAHGRTLKVVTHVRVTASASDASTPLVQVRLTVGASREDVASVALSVGLSDDPSAVQQARAPEVEREVAQVEVARRLDEARVAAARGAPEEARRLVNEARDVAGSGTLSYDAPTGERRELDLDRLADSLGGGGDGAAGAAKVSAEAGRALAR